MAAIASAYLECK